MTVVVNDLKYSLRKREFPFCCRDALSRAEELLSSNSNASRGQMLKQTEVAMEIISEFVFNEVDRKGYRKKLSSLQELEVLQVISDHMLYDASGTEASRNAVFLSLFPVALADRVRLLGGLVSLALSTTNIPVLNAGGILLQQLGHASPYATAFAMRLVSDHFLLVGRPASCLAQLPKIAPLFAANFLTAAAEAFPFTGRGPPLELLDVILEWVIDNPSLCLSPLLHKLQPTLPIGSIPMPATTPYAGLFKWCIVCGTCCEDKNKAGVYTELHVRLLETLMAAESVADRTANVIVAQELAPLVAFLLRAPTASALDKLAQTLEVAVISNVLYGPKQDLWRQLKLLPQNKHLDIVLEKYGSSV